MDKPKKVYRDPEGSAISKITRILSEFDIPTQMRMLTFLEGRYYEMDISGAPLERDEEMKK